MIPIKTAEQIDGIRKSCQLATDTLDFLSNKVRIGVTTERLNELADRFIRDHNAIPAPLNYHGFPKSICTSINEVICHGIPDQTTLKEGDIINIDVTTILNGYFGDTSAMFTVGETSDRAKKIIAVARDCLDLGVSQVKPDNPFGMIGKVISMYAKARGCSVVHQFCGHGVGLKFHEEPQIAFDDSKFDFTKMQAGMVFTVEPMINEGSPDARVLTDNWTAVTIDGALSAQFEHTILVTESGFEILTK